MADLVKKIKIKKQDGTFTDYIPIGAEAQNIETSDGDSVQLKLNKKPYYYNSVADMKADLKLKAGDMAVTLGYYSTNDGGGAEYKIVSGTHTDDGGSYHELDNSLWAELIVKHEVYPEQFGAYGDGIHDDTIAINNCINKSSVINFYNKTYLVSIGNDVQYAIDIPSNRIINGNNAILSLATNSLSVYQIVRINGTQNIRISDLKIIGDYDTHNGNLGTNAECLILRASKYVTISNCIFDKSVGDNIRITGYEIPNEYVIIDNCKMLSGGRNGISIGDVITCKISNCYFGTFTTSSPKASIDVEPFDASQQVKNLTIENCISDNTVDSYIVSLPSITSNCDITLNNLISKDGRLLLINFGDSNKVNVNGGEFERIGLAQNDVNSYYNIKGININSYLAGSSYRDASIFIDFTGSGDVAPSGKTQTGIYNVYFEGTIKGNGNYAPCWIVGHTSSIKYTNTVFDVLIDGTFQLGNSGVNLLCNRIESVNIKKSVFTPTEVVSSIPIIHTVFNDANSLHSGTLTYDYIPKNIKLCVIAGENQITVAKGDHSNTVTYAYLDGLEDTKVPAGETRFFTRIGDILYVSKI